MKASFSTILLGLVTFLTLTWTTQSAPIERRGGKGQGTYYDVGLGSCGWTNSNSQMVCALSGSIMNGNKKKYCGKSITIKSGSKSYSCKVVDTCPGCDSKNVDMSPALFKKFAPLSKGVISITWS